MIDVILSRSEAKIAKYIGLSRNNLSLRTKINQRCDPNQMDDEMNVEAVGAELAVAKVLNVYPDLSPRVGPLPKADLRYRGKLIDVKRNHLDEGDLLVRKLCDDVYYVLVCGSIPRFRIIGYIPGDKVDVFGAWSGLTYGPCWKVAPSKLLPIEELI